MIYIIILLVFNLCIIILLSNIKNPIKKLIDKDIFRHFTEFELIETSKSENNDCDLSEVLKIFNDEKNETHIKEIDFYE